MSGLNIALAAEQRWVASYKQDLAYSERPCECMRQKSYMSIAFVLIWCSGTHDTLAQSRPNAEQCHPVVNLTSP